MKTIFKNNPRKVFPGRFGALTDLMRNLETPKKTGRVNRYADYFTECP